MAQVHPKLDELVAGMVTKEVHAVAGEFAVKLTAAISAHTNTGHMAKSVKVTRANSKDYWVTITDPGAAGFNYGHINNWSGNWVRGSHVVEKTLGSM